MGPIQEEYQASPEWQEITLRAYPPPIVQKKPKKAKGKGTRHPGTNKEQSQEKTAEL